MPADETALRCGGGGLLEASIGSPPATPRSPSHPSGGEGDALSPSQRGVSSWCGRISPPAIRSRPTLQPPPGNPQVALQPVVDAPGTTRLHPADELVEPDDLAVGGMQLDATL